MCVDILQVGNLWCLTWWALGMKLFPGLECSCSGYKLGCVCKCCIFGFSFRACLSTVSSPSTNTDKTAYASSYCRSCTDHAIWLTWLTWPLANHGGWFPSWVSTNFRRCYVEGTQTFAYSTHLRHFFPCCFGWFLSPSRELEFDLKDLASAVWVWSFFKLIFYLRRVASLYVMV